MKKALRFFVVLFLCWALLVCFESVRLTGSKDPARRPLITLGSTQSADICADYQGLGFSVEYDLVYPDAFAGGTFRILGIPVARW